ncbi:MAG TPA: carboxypeptidase-like regulatory domain-containing protein [Candidatus Acidoferrum sp.]|nr:carboxypeptidase-like regulatory domain-containing protein [Candidatus Acidoferrum sp.]
MTVNSWKKGGNFTTKNFICLIVILLLGTMSAPAKAQQSPPGQADDDGTRTSALTQHALAELKDSQVSGSISGKVIDQSGAPVGGARATLVREGQSQSQEGTTDEDGQFSFANVAPGPFQLTIVSPGLAQQTIDETLTAGQAYILPDVMLMVATQVTEVHVGVTPAELAEDEVKAQEKQRMFGVIPNFFVTYEPHPHPLTAKLKFQLAWKSASDPFTFSAVGAVAGFEQASNQWKGYGQGAGGYAKRYGASYADVFAGTYLGGAVLPSLLKQDPRYFYQGKGSKRSRLLHALASAFICKGDNGRSEPNYSNIGGAFAAGALANTYYPSTQRSGARVIVSVALIRIGETVVASVFQEFLVPKVTPNLPTRSPAQP